MNEALSTVTRGVALAMAAALCFGCERAPRPPGAAGPAVPVAEGEPPAERRAPGDLVRRVREGPCGPDGSGYGRWIEEELVRAGGTLMYADWSVRPAQRGSNEVWFTYSLLDAQYRVLVGAYVWAVGQGGAVAHPPWHIAPHPLAGGAREAGRSGS